MSRLAKTVKSMRKRLRKTQSEFATTLNVQPPTISRYESGKIVPGLFVLVQLHDLANTDEKRVFAEELGRQWDAVKAEAERAAQQLLKDRVIPVLNDPSFMERMRRHFQEVAAHSQDPISEIQALWAQYSADKRAVEFFREAATYLRVRLSGLK